MKLLLALAFVSLSAHAQWDQHFAARMGMLPLHVAIAGTGNTVLVGDSNTEGFWWNTVGSCRVINAGMGGATIKDIADRADQIALITQPKLVHLMIGTNNVGNNLMTDLDADILRTVRAFWNHGAAVVLWPVPAFDEGWSSADRRDQVNAAIQRVAVQYGVFWDWWWPLQAEAHGTVPDGVHFTAAVQYSRYQRIEVWRQYLATLGVKGC